MGTCTGQRRETTLGFYDYNARQYDLVLGRFLQADLIVPQPGNPQSLNRYSYVLNNPLRYTDPSGHFSEEEIEKYLLNLGYDQDQISQIMIRWMQDEDWWAIIGNGDFGAQIGDTISGLVLDKDGLPQAQYSFYMGKNGDTFDIISLCSEGEGCYTPLSFSTVYRGKEYAISSLVALQQDAVDITWRRGNLYMGGTDYAADAGSIRWDLLRNATFSNVEAWSNFGMGIATLKEVVGIFGITNAGNVWANDVRPPLQGFYRSFHAYLYTQSLTVDKGVPGR